MNEAIDMLRNEINLARKKLEGLIRAEQVLSKYLSLSDQILTQNVTESHTQPEPESIPQTQDSPLTPPVSQPIQKDKKELNDPHEEHREIPNQFAGLTVQQTVIKILREQGKPTKIRDIVRNAISRGYQSRNARGRLGDKNQTYGSFYSNVYNNPEIFQNKEGWVSLVEWNQNQEEHQDDSTREQPHNPGYISQDPEENFDSEDFDESWDTVPDPSELQ